MEQPRKVMLAVLPFQNLSGDPSQDYFSDGLTEEMIAQLGALSPDQLGVIARTTTMAYKHSSKSVQQIGSELGVGYVLESSIRRDGDQVRISVQLIRVQNQVHGGGYAQESRDGKFVYYQKLKTNNRYDFALLPEIWRTSSAGGSEEVVVNVNTPGKPADLAWFWRVTRDGIYFVDNSAQPRPLLKLYNFNTRNVRVLRQLDKPAWGGPGLTVTPNGQNVMIGQVDDAGSDLMLVENFH